MSLENDVVYEDEYVDESSGQEPVIETGDGDNLSSELEALRSELTGLRENFERGQQEIEFLRNVGNQPAANEGDPDDFIVRNEAKELIRRELEPAKQQLRIQELNMLESRAMAKYPDYDDVVRKSGNDMLDQAQRVNPNSRALLLSLPDPAAAIYSLSKTHPNYLKDVQGKTRQETVKKIQSNLETTPTVAGRGGSPVQKVKNWLDATDAEIDAQMRKLGVG